MAIMNSIKGKGCIVKVVDDNDGASDASGLLSSLSLLWIILSRKDCVW